MSAGMVAAATVRGVRGTPYRVIPLETAENAPQESPARRPLLQILDSCLNEIENAAERGESVVSCELAARIQRHVPSINAGAMISAAHAAVLSRQAILMSGDDDDAAPAEELLTEAQARQLCGQIRHGLGELSLLLHRAHQGRAWVALGYASWERFVKTEFALSRSRSYQLLDHGAVILDLQAAAGMDHLPLISESLARQIKPVLADVVQQVRSSAEKRSRGKAWDPDSIIRDVLRKTRQRLSDVRQVRDAERARGREVDLDRLVDAIDYLAGLPSPDDVLGSLSSGDIRRLLLASDAATWLQQFAGRLERPARVVAASEPSASVNPDLALAVGIS